MTASSTPAITDAPVAGVWEIDPAHSALTITARHLMVTKVRGTFAEISGTIVVDENVAASTVVVEAKAGTVTTGATDRDGHLMSPDFLDAENYPVITFRSTEIVPSGESWKLTGDLTIRDATHPVTFDLMYEGSATDPQGTRIAAFSAVGEIDRENWGLTWNVALEGGGVLVSKKFQIEFDLEARHQS